MSMLYHALITSMMQKWGGMQFPITLQGYKNWTNWGAEEIGTDKYSERKRKAGVGWCVLLDGEAIVHREFRMPIK